MNLSRRDAERNDDYWKMIDEAADRVKQICEPETSSPGPAPVIPASERCEGDSQRKPKKN